MLLLPSLVNSGPRERQGEVFLTLLQWARAQAVAATVRPGDAGSRYGRSGSPPGLATPDSTCRGRTTRLDDGSYAIPHGDRIHRELLAAIREMLVPLAKAGTREDPTRTDSTPFGEGARHRGDVVPGDYVDRITSGGPDEGTRSTFSSWTPTEPSMAFRHRSLRCPSTGPCSRALRRRRPLVRAFMAGIDRTAPLS